MQSLEHTKTMLLWAADNYNNESIDSLKSYFRGMVHAYQLTLEIKANWCEVAITTGKFDIEAIKELLKDVK